jgi:hypothetical protein
MKKGKPAPALRYSEFVANLEREFPMLEADAIHLMAGKRLRELKPSNKPKESEAAF